jgi:hypothetical protein
MRTIQRMWGTIRREKDRAEIGRDASGVCRAACSGEQPGNFGESGSVFFMASALVSNVVTEKRNSLPWIRSGEEAVGNGLLENILRPAYCEEGKNAMDGHSGCDPRHMRYTKRPPRLLFREPPGRVHELADDELRKMTSSQAEDPFTGQCRDSLYL